MCKSPSNLAGKYSHQHPSFFNNGGAGSQPVFQQFLKASKHPKYTVSQINVYPTATNGAQVVATLAYAWSSDSFLKGRRWPPIVVGGVSLRNTIALIGADNGIQILNIICYVSLAIWDIPLGWKWACFVMMGCGGGLSGMIMA